MRSWSGKECPLPKTPNTRADLLDVIVQTGRHRRFGSCGSLEWTVLHHSVLVAFLWMRMGWDNDGLGFALAHDLHEAYTGDIPRPIKIAIGLKHVRALEDHIDSKIRAELKLPLIPNELTLHRIKVIDYAALLIESGVFGQPNINDELTKEMVDMPEAFKQDLNAVIEAWHR